MAASTAGYLRYLTGLDRRNLALTDAHTPFSLFLVRFLTELPSEGGVLDVISIYVMGALRDS